ncbi:hypothetical protein BDA99DRAFT_578841 [Phascolomyces articulosus]|uniref:Uncharacterized protein n=1 Tax=Phascolomyces articulosus TaxID=60185 RepID=A0AAD5KC86_9FUNG|nr:hypothetical protein BDA99DRAFT_578841 [Phascolomyces articulosus]
MTFGGKDGQDFVTVNKVNLGKSITDSCLYFTSNAFSKGGNIQIIKKGSTNKRLDFIQRQSAGFEDLVNILEGAGNDIALEKGRGDLTNRERLDQAIDSLEDGFRVDSLTLAVEDTGGLGNQSSKGVHIENTAIEVEKVTSGAINETKDSGGQTIQKGQVTNLGTVINDLSDTLSELRSVEGDGIGNRGSFGSIDGKTVNGSSGQESGNSSQCKETHFGF